MFVRELIQNSLDAGASRVDVQMRHADGVLTVEVIDDGEGMDRATIEGYLLVKFRSSKEEDLTKIGKFGIGFVSLFAMRPFRVEVDTGRDGVWHRVRFGADTRWTLIEMDEPIEGTVVRLLLARDEDEAERDCERIDAAARQWCRFAEGEVYTSAEGVDAGWAPRSIREPFRVDAPVQVEAASDGLRVVAGPWPAATAPVGLYNRGLTLWEGEDDVLPGVTWRAEGRHLEHTLTRDNVIRDRHHARVMAEVRALVDTALCARVHDALGAAAGDPAAVTALVARLHPRPPWAWREDLAFIPVWGRGPATIREVRGGLLARLAGGALWCAAEDGPAARQLAGERIVVRGAPDGAVCQFLAALLGRAARDVNEAFDAAEVVEPDAVDAALLAAVARFTAPLGWGELAVGRCGPALVVGLEAEGRPRPVERGATGFVVFNAEHPIWRAARGLAADLAAPIVARAAGAALGVRVLSAHEVVIAALAAEEEGG